MAVAFVLDFPGGTMEQYHEVVARMHLDGQLGPGGVAHVAGTYGDGLRVIDIWQDLAHFDRFNREQIQPHTRAAGLAAPQVRMLEVTDELPGNGERPELVQIVYIPGVDRATFEAADRRIRPGGEIPPELTFHVNGAYEGGQYVIDGWTSMAKRDAFMEARIRPAFADIDLSAPPVIEDLLVEATLGVAEVMRA